MPTKANLTDHPVIGAEIFIEPGQTPQEIENWFRVMKDCGMWLTRIRMFESYMHLPDGSWDFSLFDLAFKAAEKYGIAIYANLFPATDFTDVGGFKFPDSRENLQAIANYIQHLVTHFSSFTSLYGWVPINEPGNGVVPDNSFTKNCFANWKASQQPATYNSNGYQHFGFEEEKFLMYYNTWFLGWIIKEIRKHDAERPVHVNNHNIFQLAAEYEFPQWRTLLSSLGGSAHASWHFSYFRRQQYTLAISANSEMLRSGAGNIPWLMTELQGGNNTYSGIHPLCPTKEEITQWIWTTIFTGSKGAVFWCLNPRSSGIEAGEWGMVDFQDNPSDRLLAATRAAALINDHQELFNAAKVLQSGISILYTRESLWIEKKLQMQVPSFEGREIGGVMKSALGYFEALSEMGLQANFQEMSEYDFDKDDYSGKTIILAHQISIPSRYWPGLENFVARGGKLIADGLTAYYDENAYCLLRRFPLQKLFGGNVKEYKLADNLFEIVVDNETLPAHGWRGALLPTTGTPVAVVDEEVVALRNKWGRGNVLWMPALVGLGSRIGGSYQPLASFLSRELLDTINAQPIVFRQPQPGALLKTIYTGTHYCTLIINKAHEQHTIALAIAAGVQNMEIIFADKCATLAGSVLTIQAEETVILKWTK